MISNPTTPSHERIPLNTKHNKWNSYDESSPVPISKIFFEDNVARRPSSIELTPRTTSPPPSNMYEKIISSFRRHTRPQPINLNTKEHRLVDRDGPFHQSKGKLKIRKRIKQTEWAALYYGDLFHSILDAPTSRIITLLLLSYLLLVSIFALLYYLIAYFYDCNMGIQSYHEALIFSLETMATIGYGARDIYFGDCWLPTIILAAQICSKLVTDALIIGIIYSRIARPSKRASTVIFSKNAIIRRIKGKLYFMFQLCEVRKHQLVEAHIRLYVVRQERGIDDGEVIAPFQTCSMRLNHPNDELGGMLLLCLPQVVVHEMDSHSPLMPPPVWASSTGRHTWRPPALEHAIVSTEDSESLGPGLVYDTDIVHDFPGVRRRSANTPLESPYRQRVSVGRERLPVPSSSMNNVSLCTSPVPTLLHHPSTPVSKPPPLPPQPHSQSSISSTHARRHGTEWQMEEHDMIAQYMKDRRTEIIAIVEGVDAATGGVTQSRYSYGYFDIKWNKTFATCVIEDPLDGTAVVDFDLFHELIDVSIDAACMPDAASLI